MKKLMLEKRWTVSKNKIPQRDAFTRTGANIPTYWRTYDEAAAHLEEHRDRVDGISCYLTQREHSPLSLCVIDIDAHHTPDGKVNPVAQEVLELFSGTYYELSRSGNGYHIFFDADIGFLGDYEQFKRLYYINNSALELEVYIGFEPEKEQLDYGVWKYTKGAKKSIATTFNVQSASDEITEQTEALVTFLNKYMKKPCAERNRAAGRYYSESEIKNVSELVPTHELNMEERLQMARDDRNTGGLFVALYDNGDMSKCNDNSSKADWVLVGLLARVLENDVALIDKAFRNSKLMRPKWDRRLNNTTYGLYTIYNRLNAEAMNAANAQGAPWLNEYNEETTTEEHADISAETHEPINPEDVLDLIDQYAYESDINRITVLPLMCGTGKSTAIRLRMKKLIEEDNGEGMIVVTDNKDRIKDYLNPHDPDMAEFFQNHKDRFIAISSENAADMWKIISQYQIVIMTTQRYVGLNHQEIKRLTKWDEGLRPLILVDEAPEFQTPWKVDDKVLNTIESAINTQVPKQYMGGFVENEDQAFLTEQWGVIKGYWQRCFRGFDDKFTEEGTYYFSSKLSWNERELFDKIMLTFTKYRRFFNKYMLRDGEGGKDICKCVKSVFAAMCGDGILVHNVRPDGTFENAATVFFDNIENYLNTGAKVIILDGTAIHSVQYKVYTGDFIDVIPCSKYDRDLSRMTIHLVGIPTGKTMMLTNREQRSKSLDKVLQYIAVLRSQNNVDDAMFTYKDMEHYFKEAFPEQNIAHFGNIRGRNGFRTLTRIYQFGLNRWPGDAYFLYEYFADSQLRESIALAETRGDENTIINGRIRQRGGITEQYMRRELLAELEQNIFRGVIRDSNSTEEYHYYLFTSARDNKLTNDIKVRFEALGAAVVEESLEDEITFADYLQTFADKPKEEWSRAAMIIAWHEGLQIGSRYTMKDITEGTGLSGTQITNARQESESLDKAMSDENIPRSKPAQYIVKASWADRKY